MGFLLEDGCDRIFWKGIPWDLEQVGIPYISSNGKMEIILLKGD